MDISLTPNIERILRNKVAEGIYNSLNEAINVTLGIALNGSLISQEELDKLNKDIQIGIDTADAKDLYDAQESKQEMNIK